MKIKDYIIYGFLLVIIAILGFQVIKLNKDITTREENIGYYDQVEYKYITVYDDSKLNELKKENKELYDQIKQYKKDIDYLIQFKNTTVYITDTIYCDTSSVAKNEKTQVFEYTNKEPNDTLNYNLKISSTTEPEWYQLDISVSEEFTIMNRVVDGANTTTITPSNGGIISDVTVHKEKQNSFWSNFGIGPSITAGYDFIDNDFAVVAGVSITYQIPFKKK